MKKSSLLLFLCMLIAVSISAQSSKVVRINGTRFTLPLADKWIQSFNKEYPAIKVEIAPRGTSADSLDLQLVAYKVPADKIPLNKKLVRINRYAQLPVTNVNNPALVQYNKTGITKEKFKSLYFAEASAGSAPNQVHIYKREISACASVAFAEHFGETFEDIKGVKVAGDDKNLIESVKKDVNGITYNNLGFIYNLETRKVNDGLAIIPLDLNNNGTLDEDEKIYDNLDKVLARIDLGNASEIPVDYVSIIYPEKTSNSNASTFLNWVLKNSEKLNKENGYLNLPETEKIKSQSVAENLKK